MSHVIIKEKFGVSDIETVEMIAENPYMQYFIRLESFSKKAPTEASLLTWFRKRSHFRTWSSQIVERKRSGMSIGIGVE